MMPCLFLAAILASCQPPGGEWKRLPSLPDSEGFAGSFAGVSHGALLVAGGANFPNAKPWNGGKKAWYDTVYALEKPSGEWKVAGKLPRPLGYGVSVSHGDGVVCVGGSDATRHYADAFRLTWKDGKLSTTNLPPLAQSVANACGALVGDTLYVAGGLEKPDAVRTLHAIWAIDLTAKEPRWNAIEAWPGRGRMLATAASFDGAFFLIGGVDLGAKAEREYLKDVYRHDPAKGWTRMADLPRPLAAAPSPCPADAAGFAVLGGDDGTQIGVAPDKHDGFAKAMLRFDAKANKWSEAGELPAPRVTTMCVPWGKSWVIPTGERTPGVRSPDVWAFYLTGFKSK